MLNAVFVGDMAGVPAVHGMHDPWLVLLSLLVSVFSSTTALRIVQIASRSESRLYRRIAINTGSIALGGGIWAMHFIGMLAFQLPTQVGYAVGLTLFSLVPAWGASWLALNLLARRTVERWQLLVSGVLVGLGIGAMHYCGMMAMRTPLIMRYDLPTFILSIVVAIVLATIALWVGYGHSRLALRRTGRLMVGGLVMGLAIASMHYTGMSAIRFIGSASEPISGGLVLDNTYTSLLLAIFTIILTVLVAALNGLIRMRELYRKLEDSQVRLRATLETAVDGIITIDSRGIVQSFNRSAERLFGWTAAEVVGCNIKMLMPEPDQSRHDGYLSNYMESGKAKIIGSGREVMALRKDGSLMPMRLAVGRVDLPGELLFVGFITDVSERYALEASLRETAERAEQAAMAKSTFLANMSHEIRTPMNVILGFTELLLQGSLEPTQRSHLTTVRQSARSLLGLLNDILDTTRLEKGGLALENIDFSLKELATQILASLRLGAEAKGLTLFMHYPEEMPECFQGDPLRVQQILTNLLGNAIKFTEQGTVSLLFAYEDGILLMQVRDTGIGMSEQQVQSIFLPFTQADASISRRFGGTGLGTSIARELSELMGGRITVESRLGKGSLFSVSLPLPIGNAPSALKADKAQQSRLPSLSFLVADDVPENRELLVHLLGSAGHRVVTAADGADVLQKYRDGQFDVLLMDVHMPGTDGLQAARDIRVFEQQAGRHPTPIIALTASVMAADRKAAHESGMDGFAVKPLDPARLMSEVARVLKLDEATQESTTRDKLSLSSELVPIIDWERGIALWGGREKLAAALGTFLASFDARHPLLTAEQQSEDWQALRASLHGLSGVAGNLAIMRVAACAAELEQHLIRGEYEGMSSGILRLRGMLRQAADALRTQPVLGPDKAGQADTQLSLDWREEAPALLERLASSELCEPVLYRVCQGLEQAGHASRSQALRRALDEFEFEQASSWLRAWLEEDEQAGQQPQQGDAGEA